MARPIPDDTPVTTTTRSRFRTGLKLRECNGSSISRQFFHAARCARLCWRASIENELSRTTLQCFPAVSTVWADTRYIASLIAQEPTSVNLLEPRIEFTLEWTKFLFGAPRVRRQQRNQVVQRINPRPVCFMRRNYR